MNPAVLIFGFLRWAYDRTRCKEAMSPAAHGSIAGPFRKPSWRRPRHSSLRQLLWSVGTLVFLAMQSHAHPHVYVDGGVDFSFGPDRKLTEVRVTWLYDAFETLYILSELGITPSTVDDFTESERRIAEDYLSNFSDDFDGSVHLSFRDRPVALAWPEDLSARMDGDRLEVTFIRRLEQPINLDGVGLKLGFYERTYFFAFSLTNEPHFFGDDGMCSAVIRPFQTSDLTEEMQTQLAKLSREETPETGDIGAVFADRMVIACG